MSGQAFPHPIYRRIVLEPAYADASAYLFGPMLAASAVAWAMGLSPDLIVAGLKTFTPSEETSHGR